MPYPPPGDFPNPGIELLCPELAGRFFTTELPGKAQREELQQLKGSGQGGAAHEDGCRFEGLAGPSSQEEVSKETVCIHPWRQTQPNPGLLLLRDR